jgi:hypothetical protein
MLELRGDEKGGGQGYGAATGSRGMGQESAKGSMGGGKSQESAEGGMRSMVVPYYSSSSEDEELEDALDELAEISATVALTAREGELDLKAITARSANLVARFVM